MRASLVIIAVLLSNLASGQGTTVSGTVRDSIAASPLAGALVQLVTTDTANATPRTVVSDSVGHYRIDGVTGGRYVISFLHPLLDSLTLEPILHSLEIAGNQPVIYDLGTPSGRRLRAVFCGPRTATSSGAAFVGVVRDAATAEPLGEVSVTAEWLDMVIGRGGVTRQPMRRAVTTAANGWFALCDLPGPGNVTIHARRAADTTDLIDVAMPSTLFARRDLYVGVASSGRVEGKVINEKGAPLASAIVRIGKASTRTTADGEWKLAELPLGTRILEVHAIGYYPERRPVDVIKETAVVRVKMATFESVLDTMRVQASILRGVDEGGFEQRRRSSGSGRFLTEKDIERRAPIEISDIFKSIPGVYHEGDSIRMRSAFGSFGGGEGRCIPNVFLDGNSMPASVNDLDGWLRPTDISSIEVYPDAPPPQFQVGLSGCGSIVIWTKRKVPVRKPPL